MSSPTEKDCRFCHTIEQDPHFDFKKKAGMVHGEDTMGNRGRSDESPDSRVNATISVDKSIHDLGSIQEGTPAIVYTRIKNTGKEMVRVTDVISS
jgi:hypothetical protein